MANFKSHSDPLSPFEWYKCKEPSIFAKDLAFRARKDGKSNSEVQSEVITRRIASGESPGTIKGISQKQVVLDRLLAYKHFGNRPTDSIKHPNKHEE